MAFYATLRLGAIVVEHNPLYTPRELRHQFEDHGARIAVVWDKVVDTIADFPADLKVEHIVSVDLTAAMPFSTRLQLRLPVPKARAARAKLTEDPHARHLVPWKKLLDHRRLSKRIAGPELADTALLQYTSGTTGTPKGAILTHANLRANAMQGRAVGAGARRRRGDVLRGAAAVPRLRHDALPHFCDEHRSEARAPRSRPSTSSSSRRLRAPARPPSCRLFRRSTTSSRVRPAATLSTSPRSGSRSPVR